MKLFKKLLGIFYSPNATRRAMIRSYKKHLRAATDGSIPLAPGVTPHIAGLYGALSTRYVAAGIIKHEVDIWPELAPFIALKESEAPEVLAEYVLFCENPNDARIDWLKEKLDKGVEQLTNLNKDWRAMGASSLMQPDIPWHKLISEKSKQILTQEPISIRNHGDNSQ